MVILFYSETCHKLANENPRVFCSVGWNSVRREKDTYHGYVISCLPDMKRNTEKLLLRNWRLSSSYLENVVSKVDFHSGRFYLILNEIRCCFFLSTLLNEVTKYNKWKISVARYIYRRIVNRIIAHMLQMMFPCTQEMEFQIHDKFNIKPEKKANTILRKIIVYS